MKHKIFHRYLSAKVLPIWTILLIDVLIIVVSSLLAYALRYDFRSIFLESSTIDKTIVWTVIVNFSLSLGCSAPIPMYCAFLRL